MLPLENVTKTSTENLEMVTNVVHCIALSPLVLKRVTNNNVDTRKKLNETKKLKLNAMNFDFFFLSNSLALSRFCLQVIIFADLDYHS